MTFITCLRLLVFIALIPSYVWVWYLMPTLAKEREEFEKAMANVLEEQPRP